MAFGTHTWAKTGLVAVYGIVAALGAMLYGAHHSHEHGGGLHAHGSGGPATAAHSHPEVALLVAGAGLAIVGLTWLLLPDGRHPRLPAQVALCSAAAATIHFAVIPPHWEEYAPFAVLFALSGAFQLLWAAAVLVGPGRAIMLAGAVVNLGVAAAWVVSRTAGMPIGPEAWTPEAVGFADVAATLFELAVTAGAVALLSSAGRRLEARTTRVTAQLAATAIGITLFAALALL